MPKVMRAEAMDKAEMAWWLIYNCGNYSKREQSPKTLPKTPGTHLPGLSLTHSSLLHRPFTDVGLNNVQGMVMKQGACSWLYHGFTGCVWSSGEGCNMGPLKLYIEFLYIITPLTPLNLPNYQCWCVIHSLMYTTGFWYNISKIPWCLHKVDWICVYMQTLQASFSLQA